MDRSTPLFFDFRLWLVRFADCPSPESKRWKRELAGERNEKRERDGVDGVGAVTSIDVRSVREKESSRERRERNNFLFRQLKSKKDQPKTYHPFFFYLQPTIKRGLKILFGFRSRRWWKETVSKSRRTSLLPSVVGHPCSSFSLISFLLYLVVCFLHP